MLKEVVGCGWWSDSRVSRGTCGVLVLVECLVELWGDNVAALVGV